MFYCGVLLSDSTGTQNIPKWSILSEPKLILGVDVPDWRLKRGSQAFSNFEYWNHVDSLRCIESAPWQYWRWFTTISPSKIIPSFRFGCHPWKEFSETNLLLPWSLQSSIRVDTKERHRRDRPPNSSCFSARSLGIQFLSVPGFFLWIRISSYTQFISSSSHVEFDGVAGSKPEGPTGETAGGRCGQILWPFPSWELDFRQERRQFEILGTCVSQAGTSTKPRGFQRKGVSSDACTLWYNGSWNRTGELALPNCAENASSARASRGRKFQIWNAAYSLYMSGAKAVPIGDSQASCASRQQALALSTWCHVFHVFLMLNLFSLHWISSHRSFSWKLLIASHCHDSLCHPISSQLISSLLFSAFSPHLISSHLMS